VKPVVSEDRRAGSPSEVAELVKDALELVAEVGEPRGDLRIAFRELPREPDPDAEGHQVLLRPVVQVALDLSPLGIAGGGDLLAGRDELGGRRTELRLEPTVLEREQNGLAGSIDELRVGVQRGVVPDRRDGLALSCDEARGAPVSGGHAGDPLAPRVHEAVSAVDPERKLDGRVVERVGDDLS
jgi:hypothetical protein